MQKISLFLGINSRQHVVQAGLNHLHLSVQFLISWTFFIYKLFFFHVFQPFTFVYPRCSLKNKNKFNAHNLKTKPQKRYLLVFSSTDIYNTTRYKGDKTSIMWTNLQKANADESNWKNKHWLTYSILNCLEREGNMMDWVLLCSASLLCQYLYSSDFGVLLIQSGEPVVWPMHYCNRHSLERFYLERIDLCIRSPYWGSCF